jgi:hypothetical protein
MGQVRTNRNTQQENGPLQGDIIVFLRRREIKLQENTPIQGPCFTRSEKCPSFAGAGRGMSSQDALTILSLDRTLFLSFRE